MLFTSIWNLGFLNSSSLILVLYYMNLFSYCTVLVKRMTYIQIVGHVVSKLSISVTGKCYHKLNDFWSLHKILLPAWWQLIGITFDDAGVFI